MITAGPYRVLRHPSYTGFLLACAGVWRIHAEETALLATLGERLRAIGIYAQRGRRAALLDLAAQMPAAVLADALGLHQTTAAKWTHQAGGDWSRYAADLARHPHQT